MAVGLMALLDDVASLAKVAASSVDDIAAQAAKAGAKAAGVVIDDAAVTPRYVVGLAAERELPIIAKIAIGSLRNKLLILLPAALALNYFLPSALTPLLMLGGLYLCYEGAEKVVHALWPGEVHAEKANAVPGPTTPDALEEAKVAGAIKTDFILSAEIMTIALSAIPDGTIVEEAVALALVAIGITAAVYGVVALIVKADDVGLALAASQRTGMAGGAQRGIGRLLVAGMPHVLNVLSVVGTAAMVWVGGGILVHGLETFGVTAIGHLIHDVSKAVASIVPAAAQAAVGWIAEAVGAGVVGLIAGGILVPLVSHVIEPLWTTARRVIPARGVS